MNQSFSSKSAGQKPAFGTAFVWQLSQEKAQSSLNGLVKNL
jgi:hypothetical protein